MSFITIPPALVIILILSIIYGSIFHLFRGQDWRDLSSFILFALIGFTVGQIVGALLGLDVMRLGQVHFIEGTIFAWLLMLAFVWWKG